MDTIIQWITSIVPECVLLKKTGLYCTGCGGTRATIAFLKGHFIESFFYHPIVDYTAALGLLYGVWYLVWFLSGRRIKRLKFHPEFFYAMIVIILVQCFIKNYMLIRYGIRLI